MNCYKKKNYNLKNIPNYLKKINKRIDTELCLVEEEYNKHFPEYYLSENFKENSIKKFINEIGVIEVVTSMRKACLKINHSSHAIKYFCGICWSIIKTKNV